MTIFEYLLLPVRYRKELRKYERQAIKAARATGTKREAAAVAILSELKDRVNRFADLGGGEYV